MAELKPDRSLSYQKFWFLMTVLASFLLSSGFLGVMLCYKASAQKTIVEDYQSCLDGLLSTPQNLLRGITR